jgi:hypothetical protein
VVVVNGTRKRGFVTTAPRFDHALLIGQRDCAGIGLGGPASESGRLSRGAGAAMSRCRRPRAGRPGRRRVVMLPTLSRRRAVGAVPGLGVVRHGRLSGPASAVPLLLRPTV